MRKVLVTGASGFVGFHVINELLANDLEVYASVRASSNIAHLEGMPVKFINLSLAKAEVIRSELENYNFDYIIHIAALTKAKTQREYDRVNAEFTRNLASAAAGLIGLQKFVFISSLAALGPLNDLSDQACLTTTSGHFPVTAYGRSKVLAEKYLLEIKNLPLVILRPTAVYGPREKDIFILFRTLMKGFDPYIGRKPQKLSFIYVKDLAAIVVRSLNLPTQETGKIYNVSDGHAYSRYELADIVKRLLGKKAIRFHLPVGAVRLLAYAMEIIYKFSTKTPTLNVEKMNELTAANWTCSIEDLKRDFQFTPRYNLEMGLKETLAWYRENKWL